MSSRFGGEPVFDGRGEILSADRVHLTKAGASFFAQFIFDDPAWQPLIRLRRPNSMNKISKNTDVIPIRIDDVSVKKI